ncbi:cob(I)yrinic acid a,c-diamide adenosyltransferase [Halonotius terrestris]|uniref:Cob(I)yrinic acid a,c-diamide adenosyltransferase n=1 Tax=Halonotius terrestris TaxID=2487750 RepID=A0A8J8TCN7_9EURY|nr:cob(I)yrinic acid a,c-diamide adenosyltransferase [Halonotius terrestris]TQQ83693.1 cob(I)yrinic acid a,c-diamide adenosyltransferase [Halonotius terrestris]
MTDEPAGRSDASDTPADQPAADTPAHRQTPGGGVAPEARPIEPAAPDEFGFVQAFWGDGKGKTTAAMGMGFRAAGHGYRVHMLQFMKGGADSVDDVRGEYNAIAAMPGFSYENTGHYGWHNMADGSREEDHETEADAGLERTRDLIAAAADADLTAPFPLDSDPEDGVHMLILDEILYAADRDLVAPGAVCDLIETKPPNLELVLTGSHTEPTYLDDAADLISEISKRKHPIDAGQRARSGTEY